MAAATAASAIDKATSALQHLETACAGGDAVFDVATSEAIQSVNTSVTKLLATTTTAAAVVVGLGTHVESDSSHGSSRHGSHKKLKHQPTSEAASSCALPEQPDSEATPHSALFGQCASVTPSGEIRDNGEDADIIVGKHHTDVATILGDPDLPAWAARWAVHEVLTLIRRDERITARHRRFFADKLGLLALEFSCEHRVSNLRESVTKWQQSDATNSA